MSERLYNGKCYQAFLLSSILVAVLVYTTALFCQPILIGPEIDPTALYRSDSTNGFLNWRQTGLKNDNDVAAGEVLFGDSFSVVLWDGRNA